MVESKRDYDDRIASKEDIAAVSCSICLDFVVDGERSRAKLKCGHQFHLDCIGSAFNMKGSMQCPNCRTIEKGHWLYANDVAQAVPNDSAHDRTPEQEEPYELTFPELTFSVQWCPFGGLARYRSLPEDMETPSAIYQWLPEHALFADSVEEPIFNHIWNVIAHDEIPVSSHGFPGMDFQYQSWIHRSSSTSSYIDDAADQVTNPNLIMRGMNDELVTRSASSAHSVVPGQGSSVRPSSSFLPSGETLLSTGRRTTHERISHGRPPTFQQSVIPPTQRIRRRYFHGRPAPIVPPTPISHHDGNGNYYVMNPPVLMQHPHEVLLLRPLPSHQMQPWDLFRSSSPDNADLNWPSVYEASRTSGGVWQRYWS